MGGAGGDAERRRQWGALFDQLDANKDGRVDVEELRQGLARLGMSAGARAEEEILREGDTDHDGQLDFEEFARFLQERERRLRLMFHRLDRNRDAERTSTPQDPLDPPTCTSCFTQRYQDPHGPHHSLPKPVQPQWYWGTPPLAPLWTLHGPPPGTPPHLCLMLHCLDCNHNSTGTAPPPEHHPPAPRDLPSVPHKDPRCCFQDPHVCHIPASKVPGPSTFQGPARTPPQSVPHASLPGPHPKW